MKSLLLYRMTSFMANSGLLPFKSSKQERFMFANHPQVAVKWLKEYGHAPDWKKPKKNRRSNRGKKKNKKI